MQFKSLSASQFELSDDFLSSLEVPALGTEDYEVYSKELEDYSDSFEDYNYA